MITTHVPGSAFDDSVLVEGISEQLMSADIGDPASLAEATSRELLHLYLYNLVALRNTVTASTLASLLVHGSTLIPDDLEVKMTPLHHLPY